MSTLVTILHVVVCLFLMLTVLLQSGKGGSMGAAFGGGGTTQTVFGGSGASGFLRKLTVAAAVIFMLTSMTLAYMASTSGSDVLESYSRAQREDAARREQERLKALEAEKAGADAPAAEGTATDEVSEPGAETGAPGVTPGEGAEGEGAEQPAEAAPAAGAADVPAAGAAPSTPATGEPAAAAPAGATPPPAADQPATPPAPPAGAETPAPSNP